MAAHRPRATASLALAALSAAVFSLATAPGASASLALPCIGQTFTSGGACTLEPGQTVSFAIKAGDGGPGGNGYQGGDGGIGGAGAKVTGTYTNVTLSPQLIDVTVGTSGTPGTAGSMGSPNGTTGGDGGLSSLQVDETTIVAVEGGSGGQGGTGVLGPNGAPGVDGTLRAPGSLPPDWALVPQTWSWAGGSVVFSQPVSDAAAGPAPDQIVQEFGHPASGTCDEAAPARLDWAGVPSSGWSSSWSWWVNGGAGGPVCTRTLVYSPTRGAWTVLGA